MAVKQIAKSNISKSQLLSCRHEVYVLQKLLADSRRGPQAGPPPSGARRSSSHERAPGDAEGKALAEHCHPNVCHLLFSQETPKDVFLVLQNGGSTLTRKLFDVKGEFLNGERIYRVTHSGLEKGSVDVNLGRNGRIWRIFAMQWKSATRVSFFPARLDRRIGHFVHLPRGETRRHRFPAGD